MRTCKHLPAALLVALFAVSLAGCPGVFEDPVNRSNYDRIEVGMTQQQVENILGRGQVEESAGLAVPGIEAQTRTVRWQSNGRVITVTFIDNEVVAKTQSGL